MGQTLDADADITESIPVEVLRASRRAHYLKVGVPVAVFSVALPGLPLVVHYSELAANTDTIIPIAAATCMATFFLMIGFGLLFASDVLHSSDLRQKLPTAQLFGNRLVVTFGDQRLEARLCDCKIHEGPAWKMRLISQMVTENFGGKRRGLKLYCSHRVLLIDIPPFRKMWLTGAQTPLNTAAVGFTENTRSLWIQRIQEAIGEPSDARESPS
ncbi:MAG: hypothetical protein R3C53_17980 [Pirellulaceae bacterium]